MIEVSYNKILFQDIGSVEPKSKVLSPSFSL